MPPRPYAVLPGWPCEKLLLLFLLLPAAAVAAAAAAAAADSVCFGEPVGDCLPLAAAAAVSAADRDSKAGGGGVGLPVARRDLRSLLADAGLSRMELTPSNLWLTASTVSNNKTSLVIG
jgi:hypothetical protein